MMKCYDCIEENNDTEAVCVCISCGKALCIKHGRELELPVAVGKPPNVKRLPHGLPRFMCNYCLNTVIEEGFD